MFLYKLHNESSVSCTHSWTMSELRVQIEAGCQYSLPYVRRYIGIRLESPRTTYRGQKPECMPSGVFSQAGYSKGSIYAMSERENKVALFSNS